MNQNEKYQYNFEYSLAQYQLKKSQSYQLDEQNSAKLLLIIRRANQLIDFKCFNNRDTQENIKTLFTHYIQQYANVAMRLFKICQNIYLNFNQYISKIKRNQQDIIQSQRQMLMENLSSLNQVFYNQKQKYLKLITLCVSSSIFKILTLQNNVETLQFQAVFHTVYWQITGMHSTSQILKKTLNQTFNMTNFNHYLVNQKPVTISKLKSITQSVRRSQTQTNESQNLISSMKYKQEQFFEHRPKLELNFSKMIKRKDSNLSKQNNAYYTNKGNRTLNMVDNTGENGFNFKKDRKTYFQNFSKSKSNTKLIQNLSQNKKKTTFASYLQQKKLNF